MIHTRLRRDVALPAQVGGHWVFLTLMGVCLLFLPRAVSLWPLLVGGVICLVDSVNERDLDP